MLCLIDLCETERKKTKENFTLPQKLEKQLIQYGLAMEAKLLDLVRIHFSPKKESFVKYCLKLFLERYPDISFPPPIGTSFARPKEFIKESLCHFFNL